ncbi:hypothetical protein PMIN02_001345 [Paraphaeosphaeria minitans]
MALARLGVAELDLIDFFAELVGKPKMLYLLAYPKIAYPKIITRNAVLIWMRRYMSISTPKDNPGGWLRYGGFSLCEAAAQRNIERIDILLKLDSTWKLSSRIAEQL